MKFGTIGGTGTSLEDNVASASDGALHTAGLRQTLSARLVGEYIEYRMVSTVGQLKLHE